MVIERTVQQAPWTRGIFQDSLDAGCSGLVIEHEGRIVGYSILGMAADESTLLTIAIKTGHHNCGYGEQLLGQSQALAKFLGARVMFLEVRLSNTEAKCLYLKMGFKQIAIRKNYYRISSNSREDALVMRCELK